LGLVTTAIWLISFGQTIQTVISFNNGETLGKFILYLYLCEYGKLCILLSNLLGGTKYEGYSESNLPICEIRAVNSFLRAKNMSASEIHRELCAVYGQNLMSE
jgi:hypothetical protein